ncbi:MAG: DUF309 domain-containing protein [Thermodesulfobacteriota bacterium]
MRRRSKIEVEIRNILSEELLASLRHGEASSLLYLLFRFCEFIKECGGNKIRLNDLLQHRANIFRLRPNWEKLSKRQNFRTIFGMDSEDYIQLNSRFERHLSVICNKSRLYWNFVSSLFSKKEAFKVEIEGEIKKGVLLFNEGLYFECHEFLEEIWRKENGREKEFLKGLIHAAVAFYHLEYENYKGTVNYLRRSYKRLKEFEPVFMGVDIRAFLSDVDNFLKSFEKSESGNQKEAIPKIRMVK